MKNFFRNLLATIGLLSIVLVICSIALLYLARPILKLHIPIENPDWIVVLGGDSGQRIFQAAELYNKFPHSRIFIAGGQECELLTRRLIMVGIPMEKMARECQSRTTYENALYTRNLLRDYHPKSLLLVTSWYHTRRSVEVFRQLMPESEIGAYAPASEDLSFKRSHIIESSQLLTEYIKSAWYLLAY